MKLSSSKLIGLIVETEAGRVLGKVESFNVEVDSQSILEYKIKPSSLVKGLIKDDLIISRGQVIELTDEKMVVEDLITKEDKKSVMKNKTKEEVVQGAVLKEK